MIKSLISRFKKASEPTLEHIFITDRVVPVFHDIHQISNKRINFSQVVPNVNEVFLEKQAGNIVLATDDLTHNNGDLEFQVNGIKIGQCYEVTNLGYLGNLSELCEVKLVTDKYVFFKDTDGSISAYSHEELIRIRSNNSLSIVS